VQNQVGLLTPMAILDVHAGRLDGAAAHLQEAVQVALRIGHRNELLNGLEGCGLLCTATGRYAEAVTVWAAYTALMRHVGYAVGPASARRRDETLREARQVLGPDLARAAEDRGTAMSLATAAEFVLMLTAPVPQPTAALAGTGQLSAPERELLTLVARGCTDAQIAGQLCISVRDVRSQLDRIRGKTGCQRRADLTRLALQAGLV
jgi:DNA-binding CsgD family transcriptional regulator